MALSVYVHIPYCLQRCRYCDFTTFEWSEILPPEAYVEQLLQEIRHRRNFWPESEIQTLYFGGGTPSLISPELILNICTELANSGFEFQKGAEITIEINPATITKEKLEVYLRAGINRFSVGAQSFNDSLLKLCGRRHSADDTRETLRLLASYRLNYSFDLLFALPKQTMADLDLDLDEVVEFSPPHLSAYCLTVPEGHVMSVGRPPEGEQIEMFARIEDRLKAIGLLKYEISNFARPNYESRHNQAYWNDSSYWGIGVSSHSYSPNAGPYGMRFWNPKSLKEYAQQADTKGQNWEDVLPPESYEKLQPHESLTDFFHMHLRTSRGLSTDALRRKFPLPVLRDSFDRLKKLTESGLLDSRNNQFCLTKQGELISNKVFEELTFLPD